MTQSWHARFLGFSAIMVAACSTDVSNESEGLESVASVAQKEILTCPSAFAPMASSVDYDKEIVIKDVSVVEDICRTNWNSADPSCTSATRNKWHFWYLMQQMAGTGNVTRFVLRWLESYISWPDQVNQQTLQTRTRVRSLIIDPWMTKTNTANSNTNCKLNTPIDDPTNVNCQLDPAFTPLRLLAIVNRTDLRAPGAANSFYGSGSAGEGRFVFGFTQLGTTDANSIPPGQPKPAQAAVILEYKLPTPQNWNPQQWAQRWHALGTSANYNSDLQTLTNAWTGQFAASGPNNGSAISQVRMNDFDFDQGRLDPVTMMQSKVWSLREFKLGCPSGKSCTTNTQWLVPVTVTHTPSNARNNTSNLTSFIAENSNAILTEADTYSVPPSFNGSFFLGAESTSTSKFSAFGPVVWTYPGYDPTVNTDDTDLRRRMAFVTCNGCHYAETETNNFHVAPRPGGRATILSNFVKLQITTTSDLSGTTFQYDEPARRKCELAALALGSANKVSSTTGRPH